MVFNMSNSTTAEVAAILDELKLEVNNILASVKSEVNGMITNLNGVVNSIGTVKSIQRGTLEPTGSGAPEVTVNINTVNPDKCMVLLNTSLIMGGDTAYTPALLELTATSFTVTWNGTWSDGCVFSWQVIEFY